MTRALVRKYLFTVIRISESSFGNNRVIAIDKWSWPWWDYAIS